MKTVNYALFIAIISCLIAPAQAGSSMATTSLPLIAEKQLPLLIQSKAIQHLPLSESARSALWKHFSTHGATYLVGLAAVGLGIGLIAALIQISKKDDVIKTTGADLVGKVTKISELEKKINELNDSHKREKDKLDEEWKKKFQEISNNKIVENIESSVNNNILKREKSEIENKSDELKNKVKEKLLELQKKTNEIINKGNQKIDNFLNQKKQ